MPCSIYTHQELHAIRRHVSVEELREELHKTLLRLLPPVPLSQLLVHAVDREALVAAEDAERVVELLKSLGPASRNDTLPSKESVLLGRWSSSKTVETGRGWMYRWNCAVR